MEEEQIQRTVEQELLSCEQRVRRRKNPAPDREQKADDLLVLSDEEDAPPAKKQKKSVGDKGGRQAKKARQEHQRAEKEKKKAAAAAAKKKELEERQLAKKTLRESSQAASKMAPLLQKLEDAGVRVEKLRDEQAVPMELAELLAQLKKETAEKLHEASSKLVKGGKANKALSFPVSDLAVLCKSSAIALKDLAEHCKHMPKKVKAGVKDRNREAEVEPAAVKSPAEPAEAAVPDAAAEIM